MAGDITTVARPYAEAIFARARESDQVASWGEMLATLSAIAGDDLMASQIANPNVSRSRLSEVMLQVAGSGISAEGENLLSLLAANDRLATLPEITRLYAQLRTQYEGVRQVHVTSAFDLSDGVQQELVKVLEKRLGAEVEMTAETDPSLIGGVEIRVGDLVIDGSVRGKLHKLASELQF